MLVVGIAIWLLVHVLGGVWIYVHIRLRDAAPANAFFNAPANAVWCSPLLVEQPAELERDASLREAVRAQVVESVERVLGAGVVAECFVWSPAEAVRAIEASRDADVAAELDPYPYTSTKPCVVLRFHTAERAERMVTAARQASGAAEGLQERHPLGHLFAAPRLRFEPSCLVHILNMAYYPLSAPTATPTAGLMKRLEGMLGGAWRRRPPSSYSSLEA